MLKNINISLVSIFCAIGASFCFSLSDFTVKILSENYPLHQIILIRSVSAFLVTLLIFVPLEGGLKVLKPEGLSLIYLEVFFLYLQIYFFFLD